MTGAIRRFLHYDAIRPHWTWFRRFILAGLIIVWVDWSWSAYWLVYDYAPVEPALPRCYWHNLDRFDREEKMSPEFVAAFARYLSAGIGEAVKYQSIHVSQGIVYVPRRFTSWWDNGIVREKATMNAVEDIWKSLPEEKRGPDPINSEWAEKTIGEDTCARYLPYITGKLPPKYAKNKRGYWEAVLD